MVQEVAGSNPVGHPPYLGEKLKYKVKNAGDFEKQLDLKVDFQDLDKYKNEAINKISKNLNENNYEKFVDFLDIPLSIKGYGHVKEKNMINAENKWDKTLNKILVEKDLKKVS